MQTANRNSKEMFWLIVEYLSPFASSWDSCWSAKAETKAITEMIAITSKSNNALPFGGKSNKSFDNKSSSTFLLVDATVDWISNFISACANCPSSHESSCASQLAVCCRYLKSHETSCIFPLATCAKCLRSQALCIAYGTLACPSIASMNIFKVDSDVGNLLFQIFINIKADSNFIQYSSSVLWQMNKMCSTYQMVANELTFIIREVHLQLNFHCSLNPTRTSGWLSNSLSQILRENATF